MERSSHLLEVSHELRNEGVVVTARGELDLLTTPQLTEELTTACRSVQPPALVVVDLRAVTFLGSQAIGSLVQIHENCTDAGTPLRLVAADRVVLRPLKMLGLGTTFHISEEIETAVADAMIEPEPTSPLG